MTLRSGIRRAREALCDVGEAALDWLYPRHCYHCDELISERRERVLCPQCRRELAALRITGTICPVCGLPVAEETPADEPCLTCRSEPRRFEVARAFFPYAGPVVSVIKHFKFGGQFFLGPLFLRDLLETAEFPPEMDGADVVVPVPLHPRRLQGRGYDQVLLLSRVVARHADLPLVNALACRRYTAQQSRLPHGGRRRNVAGAFAVGRPEAVEGRSVLLVDDVMTTGATVDACARALKRKRAREVKVLTLARATA